MVNDKDKLFEIIDRKIQIIRPRQTVFLNIRGQKTTPFLLDNFDYGFEFLAIATYKIVSIGLVSYFTRPRPDQRGLYSVSRPDPESLLLTVNKIKNLVGEENVGVPMILDQRLPEAFNLDSECLPLGREKLKARSENLTAAFKYFRPPVPADVTVENKRLLFIRTPHFSGKVKQYSGVWKKNSYWWKTPWKTQEWDVEIENEGIYRLSKNEMEWFLTGEYD